MALQLPARESPSARSGQVLESRQSAAWLALGRAKMMSILQRCVKRVSQAACSALVAEMRGWGRRADRCVSEGGCSLRGRGSDGKKWSRGAGVCVPRRQTGAGFKSAVRTCRRVPARRHDGTPVAPREAAIGSHSLKPVQRIAARVVSARNVGSAGDCVRGSPGGRRAARRGVRRPVPASTARPLRQCRCIGCRRFAPGSAALPEIPAPLAAPALQQAARNGCSA